MRRRRHYSDTAKVNKHFVFSYTAKNGRITKYTRVKENHWITSTGKVSTISDKIEAQFREQMQTIA